MPRPVKYTEHVEKKPRSEVLKMSPEEKKAYQAALNRQRVSKTKVKKEKVIVETQDTAVKTIQAAVRRRINDTIHQATIAKKEAEKQIEQAQKVEQAATKIQTAVRHKQAKDQVKKMEGSLKKLQAVMKRKVYYDVMNPMIKAEHQRRVYEQGYLERQATRKPRKSS